MLTGSKPSYYLVAADTLPEVFLKVSKAKELLETGEAKLSPRQWRPSASAAALFISTRIK